VDNLQNAGLVRFVARFINQETLGKWLSKILYMLNNNSFRDQAGKLLAWAIVIIIIATVIDQIFYWTRPEQKVILMRYITNIKERIEKRSVTGKLNRRGQEERKEQ